MDRAEPTGSPAPQGCAGAILTVERDLLKEQLKAFQRRLFAAKREARGSEQKDLFFNEAEALAPGEQASPALEEDVATAVKVAGHTRTQRGRKPLDPGLPRVEVRHELPASERVCPHDGQALVEIGVEISEQLDIVPQQIRVVQHQRVKYACPCCDAGIKTTPAPARVIAKGLLTESALAWCIANIRTACRCTAGGIAQSLRSIPVTRHARSQRGARGQGRAAADQPAARYVAGV